MKRSRRAGALVMAAAVVGAGVIGVWSVRGSGGTVRLVEARPGIALINLPGESIRCAQVSVSRDRIGEYARTARNGEVVARVMVRDDRGSSSPGTAAVSVATRHDPERFRVDATVKGPIEGRAQLAASILAASTITRQGVASSLTVRWPDGFQEVAAGVPIQTEASWDKGMAQMLGDQASDDSSTPDGSDDPTPFRAYRGGMATQDESGRITFLRWSIADPLTSELDPANGGRNLTIAATEASTWANGFRAHRNLDGLDLDLLIGGGGVTQQRVDGLLAGVTAGPATCPIPAMPAEEMVRVALGDLVVHATFAGDVCPTDLDADADRMFMRLVPTACATGFVAAGFAYIDGAPIRILVGPGIDTVQMLSLRHDALGPSAQVVRSSVDGRLGLVTLPAPSQEVVLLEGRSTSGSLAGSATLTGYCDWTDSCSAFRQVLATPPVAEESDDSARLTVHLGLADVPMFDGTDRRSPSSLLPVGSAQLVPSLCAVLQGVETGPSAANPPLRESMNVCAPTNAMQGSFVRFSTATLDYLSARTEGLALVSANVQTIRVTEGTKARVIPVSRRTPGPGVALWSAGFDGDEQVEGLDASGAVIAVAPKPE